MKIKGKTRIVLFCLVTAILVVLMVAISAPAVADEWYSAADTVRDAGVGTYDESDVDVDAHIDYYAEDYQSEYIYYGNGRTCFKMETESTVSYHCN